MYETYDYTSKQTTLDFDKVGASLPVGLHFAQYDVDHDRERQLLHHRLTAYVLTEHLANDTQTATMDVPADWWQHTKEAWVTWAGGHRLTRRAAEWVKHHWPVRCETKTLTVTWKRAATRPESRLPVNRLGPVIYQEQMDWRFQ